MFWCVTVNCLVLNPFTASCENAMTLSVTDVPASCEKFPHSSQLNFWFTESIFNQFSVFLKTLNALCVWLQYKHPRSVERVIRSDKPVTLILLFWSHKCDFGAEPRSRIIATSAVKGLKVSWFASCRCLSFNIVVWQPLILSNCYRDSACFLGVWQLSVQSCASCVIAEHQLLSQHQCISESWSCVL
jgi:hypothetical protein